MPANSTDSCRDLSCVFVTQSMVGVWSPLMASPLVPVGLPLAWPGPSHPADGCACVEQEGKRSGQPGEHCPRKTTRLTAKGL